MVSAMDNVELIGSQLSSLTKAQIEERNKLQAA